jgi:hypothetical protein
MALTCKRWSDSGSDCQVQRPVKPCHSAFFWHRGRSGYSSKNNRSAEKSWRYLKEKTLSVLNFVNQQSLFLQEIAYFQDSFSYLFDVF